MDIDPFTQRMLEKAEQRSRALGISSSSKFPMTESSETTNASSVATTTTASSAKSAASTIQQKRSSATLSQATTNTNSSVGSYVNKLQVVEKPSTTIHSLCSGATGGSNTRRTPEKVLRQFSAIDKENMDMGIEINIMTDKNVEVQVQVEEQEVTDDEENYANSNTESMNPPLARIRDTSRNRLQRLGALYSNTNDLSSPIHRTEGQFHADECDADKLNTSPTRPRQRLNKLAALANTINQWEDDTSHSQHSSNASAASGADMPPPKPDLPSRYTKSSGSGKGVAPPPPKPDLPSRHSNKKAQAPAPPTDKQETNAEKVDTTKTNANNKTKEIKWDPKVIHSLEAQGFQRRESSTVKYAYDYKKEQQQQQQQKEKQQEQQASRSNSESSNASSTVCSTTVSKLAANVFAASQDAPKTVVAEKKIVTRPGLVSGRAAAIESKVSQQLQNQVQRAQKDPTELSLKERMQLFERNKGEALIPKAAFHLAPPIIKIRTETTSKKESDNKVTTPTMVTVKTTTESKLRDKVAALVAANATTISEQKIKTDIQKQREEDMQVLANRFNRQKAKLQEAEEQNEEEMEQQQPLLQNQQQQQPKPVVAKDARGAVNSVVSPTPPPPPPPPPMPSSHLQASFNNKRRSPGNTLEDERKRARKSNTATISRASAASRLYPTLSDLDNADCLDVAQYDSRATSTAAGGQRTNAAAVDDDDDDDEENNSYMDSEADDSSAGICNGSLGREIMQVVKSNESQQQQQRREYQTMQQQQQQQQQQQSKPIKAVHYADRDYYYGGSNVEGDSSMNSSEASMGVDDYLDEALDEDDDEDDEQLENAADDDETPEASDVDGNNASRASRGSKGTTASNSFSFRKTPKKFINCQPIAEDGNDDFNSPETNSTRSPGTNSCSSTVTTNTNKSNNFNSPVKSELSVKQGDDDNMVTLVHTVSFYRRQQQNSNSASSTPIRKICREQQVPRSYADQQNSTCAKLQFDEYQDSPRPNYNIHPTDDDAQSTTSADSEMDETHLVQDKIKKLLDEVCKQQQIIGQTSQALNLCAATIEFSGSTESVEGERHLLVATHRRQACLDEVQRLRVEQRLRPVGSPSEKGRLSIKEITVPLRQDYIRKLAADTISGHHLVCLLKYNEHVLATKTVPTLPGLLAVKFPDVLQMNNVYADFRVTLEIYGMTAQREVLPHEVKYHINMNKKSGIKTPKKKSGENRLVMPPVQSPAGPNAVRTPALVQYGFAIFSLREIQRTTWTLTQVLGVSPLDGVVHMKVNCELTVTVDYHGFLTMFEDISGFGAWHRRWCHLNGHVLNYWKYPDDEKKKTPMGSIDLYTCSSQKVAVAPRDICARLNTMLLECQRPAKDTDQESLIIVPNGRTTIVRHLLSADTKEEREEWSAYFNKALTLIRAWGPPQ